MEMPSSKPPIIITSVLEDTTIEAVEAGADDFFSKPFAMAEVCTRVRSVLPIRHLSDELERTVTYIEELQQNGSKS